LSEGPPGRLIALEGIDGSGKSTQARLLAESLGALLTHEPGATELGRALRRLLLDPAGPEPLARAEALLMAADRAQHVEEVVRPALAGGRWVVSDRYSGSTLAYQGWGRGLPPGPLRQMVAWAAGDLEPDLSVLVDVSPAVARERLAAGPPDRLERLDPDFFRRVHEGFASLAADDPAHWAVVDGSGTVEEVARAVAAAVGERLGSPTGGEGVVGTR
jgi:dTMP kinase